MRNKRARHLIAYVFSASSFSGLRPLLPPLALFRPNAKSRLGGCGLARAVVIFSIPCCLFLACLGLGAPWD